MRNEHFTGNKRIKTAHTYFMVAILPDDVKSNGEAGRSSLLMDAVLDNGYSSIFHTLIDNEVFYRCFLFVPRDCFGFRPRRSS
jgi:hypothetical protein